MSAYLKRLAILIVAILVVAGVDGAIRGLRMPAQASTELSASTQDLITQARARQQAARVAAATDTTTIPDAAAPAEDPADGKGMLTADLHAAWEAGLVTLVDARLPSQHREGHIPGSLSIAFEEISTGYPPALDVLPYEGPTIVYCDGGDCNASRNVASMLIELGYENVSVFERGMEAWVSAGYPVQSGGGE